MPNSDPWDRFVYPYLTLMSDYYIPDNITLYKAGKSIFLEILQESKILSVSKSKY